MPFIPSAELLHSEAVTLEPARLREAVRRWVRPTTLPATREQLTAYLMDQSAPTWLVWRLNACVPLNRVVTTPEHLLQLMRQKHTQSPVPAIPYAG